MKMKKIFSLLPAAVMAMPLLAGCGDAGSQPAESTQPAGDGRQYDGVELAMCSSGVTGGGVKG